MTTLKSFMENRKSEILKQIEDLKSELAQLEIAQSAIKESGKKYKNYISQFNLYTENKPLTIKGMILKVLEQENAPLTAIEILNLINARFDKDIERTSLSPQLSRLKEEGSVLYDNKYWTLADREIGVDDLLG